MYVRTLCGISLVILFTFTTCKSTKRAIVIEEIVLPDDQKRHRKPIYQHYINKETLVLIKSKKDKADSKIRSKSFNHDKVSKKSKPSFTNKYKANNHLSQKRCLEKKKSKRIQKRNKNRYLKKIVYKN